MITKTIVPVQTKSGSTSKGSSIIKESKYIRRDSIIYFDRSEIDPRLETEFFEMIDLSKKGSKNTISLAQVYDLILRSPGLVKLIPNVELARFYKRMYLVILRFTSFIKSMYVIMQVYPNRLVDTLINKVN